MWSWNGDFIPGKDGDLADTEGDQIQSLIQDIQTIVASEIGDWEEDKSRGADLFYFAGEPNSRETATGIKTRLRDALVLSRVVRIEDLDIKVLPIGKDAVLIIVRVAAQSTPRNSLENNLVVVSTVFDLVERGIMFL